MFPYKLLQGSGVFADYLRRPVCYRTIPSPVLGQEIVDAGAAVERRVLAIPADRSYITVEPGQTAESYTVGLRQKYITALVLAGAYVLLYVAAWCVIFGVRKKRMVK